MMGVPAALQERLNAALAGRYVFTDVLGEGGMATVFRARDERHGRDVAIKVLTAEFSAAGGAERFQSEIRTTAALNHPNILPLFDSGMVEGHAYYVMPVVEGESLQDRLERERALSPLEAGRIAAAAARALAYAHARGVVHRDIKPANLLLHAGHTMIADFGISLVTGSDSRLTRTGTWLGTLYYMSPEQIDGSRDPDGRSDQYALGCVLFEMLEARPPFQGPSAQAVMVAHLTQTPPALAGTSREARALMGVVSRALAKDPADRFASMTGFADAIEAAVSSDSTPGGVARRGIVVLPFTNMSSDPNDEYFSDGLTEEVISDLSRMKGLRVISRTSAMQYKATALKLPEIAADLGVRYALEGGVRKSGNRLRISAQLIDTETEEHLWSNKYDGAMDDIFDIQDEVSAAIAEALSVVLSPEEKQAIRDRHMPDAEALEHYMRAKQAVISFDADRMRAAIANLERLLAEHGDHLELLKGLAYLHWNMMNAGISIDARESERVDEYVLRMEKLAGGAPWAAAFKGLKEAFTDPVSGASRMVGALAAGLDREPDMLWWTGGGLAMMGLADLGEPYIAELRSVDPKGHYILFGEWALAAYRGRWADAIHAVDSFPDEVAAGGVKEMHAAWSRGAAGDVAEAIEQLEPIAWDALEGGFAFLGRILLAAYRGDPLPEPSPEQREAAWRDWQYSAFVADAYAMAGRRTDALHWLSHAVDKGFYQADFISRHNQHLAGIRDDPAFKRIVQDALLGAARLRARIERMLAPTRRTGMQW